MSNQLPLRPKAGGDRHEFEWDEDALIAQAKEGLPDDMEAVYVGCLPFEVDVEFQEVRVFFYGEPDILADAFLKEVCLEAHLLLIMPCFPCAYAGNRHQADQRLPVLPGLPGGGAEEQLLQTYAFYVEEGCDEGGWGSAWLQGDYEGLPKMGDEECNAVRFCASPPSSPSLRLASSIHQGFASSSSGRCCTTSSRSTPRA